MGEMMTCGSSVRVFGIVDTTVYMMNLFMTTTATITKRKRSFNAPGEVMCRKVYKNKP